MSNIFQPFVDHFSQGESTLHIVTHVLTLAISLVLFSLFSAPKKNKINSTIRMDEPKVVDKATIEHLQKKLKEEGKPLSICRCWKSKRFPFCDATHAKLNKEGENVGPFVVLPK